VESPETQAFGESKHKILKITCSRIENIYYTEEIIPTICTITNFIPQVSQN
jgi:hypothetical protein